MFFSPADLIAPAPNTTWHVRELNAFRYSITRPIVSVVSVGRFTTTCRYSTSIVSTRAVADTTKYVRSSMRMCFVLAVPTFEAPEPRGATGGGALLGRAGAAAEVGVSPPYAGNVVAYGLKIASSDVITRSGWSRTAESTTIFAMCCRAGVTSAGFHFSSSTSRAEEDTRV